MKKRATNIKYNKNQLIEMAVQGTVQHPRFFSWEVTHQGAARVFPSVGGIVYNVKVGDSVYGWQADHIEPAVSATAPSPEKGSSNANLAFNVFSCVGNRARLISGEAKGDEGVVTGHHGGVEHVLIDFPDKTLRKMTQDDKILIHGHGFGLTLLDFPQVTVYGVSPNLFESMPLRVKEGALEIPVTARIPAMLMGSGLGSDSPFKGDYDLQTSDQSLLREHGLENLKLGDLVAIQDHHAQFGFAVVKGAVTIGVVVHGDSFLSGHGPGIQALFTCRDGASLQTRLDANANIGAYLGIGRWRD